MKTTRKEGPLRAIGYDRIAEKPEKWQLDEAGYRALRRVDWVVTEKIHGANFCLITNGREVKCAKRKGLLEEGEDFFGHLGILDALSEKTRRAFSLLKAELSRLEVIYLYGEIFGGSYPHPEVTPIPSVSPVQTGVYYCPGIEFSAFDIAALLKGESTSFYLDYHNVINIFREAGFFYAEPLFVGKYEEAIGFPVGFSSTIPARLGLPPLSEENKAEGVVIKPMQSLLVEAKEGKIRPILKKKIPEFAEEQKFYQAKKWEQPQSFSPSALSLLSQAIPSLVTENRLHNTISKVGRSSLGDKKRAVEIFQLFVEDVFLQLQEDYSSLFQEVSPREKNKLTEMIKEETRALLRRFWAKTKK